MPISVWLTTCGMHRWRPLGCAETHSEHIKLKTELLATVIPFQGTGKSEFRGVCECLALCVKSGHNPLVPMSLLAG
eukprot:1722747-Rhodomonas_salina.1